MHRRVLGRAAVLAGVVTIAGLTSAAGAQQGYRRAGSQPQGQYGQQWQQQGSSQTGLNQLGLDPSRTGRMTSIEGTITGTKEVSLGDREPYLFASVEDNEGKEKIVNLGPADELDGTVSEGDNIEVRAVYLPILGHDVYHTVALRTEDGQTMRVKQIQDPEVRAALGQRLGERWRQERQERFQSAGFGQQQRGGGQGGLRQLGMDPSRTGRMTSIEGTINATKEVSLGDREPYLFASIDDDRGMEKIVNLGPADEVDGMFSEGDNIEVRAVLLPILGRDVYHTVALRTEDGQTMRVKQIQNPEVRAAIQQRAGERWRDRSQQSGFQQQGSPQTGLNQLGMDPSRTGRMTSIEGTITGINEVSLGDREPYLFANVEDNEGKEKIVNLGPADELDGMVSEGDNIEVRAVFLPILGRDVYHTVALRTEDGQTMRVKQIQDPEARAALREHLGERWRQQRSD